MKIQGYLLLFLLVEMLIKATIVPESVSISDETPLGTQIGDLKNTCPGSRYTHSILKKYKGHEYFTVLNGRLSTKSLIDMDTLCIEIHECCDKEKEICRFTIGVACKDVQTQVLNIQEFSIDIKDQNDNFPSFNQTFYKITLPEDLKVGSDIHLPTATDSDFGKNRIQIYKIGQKNPDSFEQFFQLRVDKTIPIKAELRLKKNLDRETINMFSFELLAVDGEQYADNSRRNTGSISITIKIADENDNMPKFTQSYYKYTIKEGEYNSLPILKFEANDPDENLNAKILYKLDPNNKNDVIQNDFRIEEETGVVYLKHALDYEKQSSYKFTVVAINPTPLINTVSSTSSATVEVFVENIYDEPLNINIDYLDNKNYSEIVENKDTRFVAYLSVKSQEAGQYGPGISCNLKTFADKLILDLKKDDGPKEKSYEVRTISKIDREVYPNIVAKIICKESVDSNVPSYSAFINISIIDENDNSPVLTIIGNKFVRENTKLGTEILTINASDQDKGENGRVTFSIEKSDSLTLDYLTIGENDGIIRVKKEIDREVNYNHLTNLTVIVTAKDHGSTQRSTDLMFDIRIIDENDNFPVFSTNPMSFSIKENLSPPITVGEIEVEDRDSEDDIILELVNPNPISFPFRINKKPHIRGVFQLTTIKSLDREKDSKFSFSVLAYDGRGTLAHTATGTIEVNVIDVNDNSPIIIFPPQNNASRHIISYLEPKNFKFMTVSANDQDQSKENNEIEFKLESSSDIFAIDRHDGFIYTSRGMTQNDIGDHVIKIIVSNIGHNPLQSSVTVNILIDKSIPKTLGAQSDINSENNFSVHPNPIFGSSEIIITILTITIVFVLFIVIAFVCFGLRHCNKEPLCLRNILDKFFHSEHLPVKNSKHISIHDGEISKDQHQESIICRDPSNNWSQPNHLDGYNTVTNINQYPKAGYTKLSNQSPYYLQYPVYHTIDDPKIVNKFHEWNRNQIFVSLPNQRKPEHNYKSELTLNTDNLFYEQNPELAQINEHQKMKWMSSLTPMPMRSKSVVNRVIPNDENESSFAVVYPQEQSTFV